MVAVIGEQKLRVVIADDVDDMRLLLRLQLESSGDVEVVAEAADGHEALRAVRREHPDALILDMGMPELDGMGVLEALRDDEHRGGMRVVVYTAAVNDGLRVDALASGADAYLDKGVAWDELMAALAGPAGGVESAAHAPRVPRPVSVPRAITSAAAVAVGVLTIAGFDVVRDLPAVAVVAVCIATSFMFPIHILRGPAEQVTMHIDGHVNVACLGLISGPAFFAGNLAGFVAALVLRRLPPARIVAGTSRQALTLGAGIATDALLTHASVPGIAAAVVASGAMVATNVVVTIGTAYLEHVPFPVGRTIRRCSSVWVAVAPIGVVAVVLWTVAPAALILVVLPWAAILVASTAIMRLHEERELLDALLTAATDAQAANSVAEVEDILAAAASTLLDGAPTRTSSTARTGDGWASVALDVDGNERYLLAQVGDSLRGARSVLEPVATVGSAVLSNAARSRRHIEDAMTDSLTGLPNGRAVRAALDRIVAHAERVGSTAAVLFIDLDSFKQLNDTLGHDAGDEVLRQFAARLAESIRPYDLAARLGGDEFVVVLGAAPDASAVAQVVERVQRRAFEPYDVFGTRVTVGASIGAAVHPDECRSPSELVHAADLAMYEQKRSRQRVRSLAR